MRLVATAAALTVWATLPSAWSQDNRSLTGFEIAPPGQVITVPDPEGINDAGSTEEKLVLARSAIAALTESLAMANAEAEIFKRQSAELQLKLDAYGLAGLENQPERVEQRLLAAVRDLRLLKKQNEDAFNQLIRLSEAIQVLIKTTEGVNPQARLTVETELRKTREILGTSDVPSAESAEPTLTDAVIVDVKDEFSMVVANVGRRHGVKVGMPFQVWRDSRQIGSVRVVDVRDRIAGAIIQNLVSDKETIKTGDRLRVDAKP